MQACSKGTHGDANQCTGSVPATASWATRRFTRHQSNQPACQTSWTSGPWAHAILVATCARSSLIDALQVSLVLKNKPSLKFQILVGKFPIDQPERTLRESRLLCQSGHRYHHSSNGETSIMQTGRRHLWPLCRQLPRRL